MHLFAQIFPSQFPIQIWFAPFFFLSFRQKQLAIRVKKEQQPNEQCFTKQQLKLSTQTYIHKYIYIDAFAFVYAAVMQYAGCVSCRERSDRSLSATAAIENKPLSHAYTRIRTNYEISCCAFFGSHCFRCRFNNFFLQLLCWCISFFFNLNRLLPLFFVVFVFYLRASVIYLNIFRERERVIIHSTA